MPVNDRARRRVALGADRVLLGRVRQVLLDEVPTERRVRRGRARGRRRRASDRSPSSTEVGGIVLVDEAVEERRGVRSDTTPRVGLLGAGDGLTPCGDDALADALVERLAEAVERLGHRGDACGHGLPSRRGSARGMRSKQSRISETGLPITRSARRSSPVSVSSIADARGTGAAPPPPTRSASSPGTVVASSRSVERECSSRSRLPSGE